MTIHLETQELTDSGIDVNAHTNYTALRAISLFSGAGGMDAGFKKAGIHAVLANEMDKNAASTYRLNYPETRLLEGDVADYLPIIESEEGIDFVFGGPPCQGFSVAGRMDPNDERSKLIWTYLDVVERVQPRTFVLENVKALAALTKWQDIRDLFVQKCAMLGYHVEYFVLNSADYGVPQKRERVFFIGSRQKFEREDFLAAVRTHEKPLKSLRETFAELPAFGTLGNENTCTAKITLASTPIMRKSPYAGMIFNGMGRPLNIDSVSTTLPASMGGNKTPVIDQSILEDQDAFDWVRDYHEKLSNDATASKFGLAPSQLRRMTTTEASAIQTFPTNYKFSGPTSSVYRQIGNAVPCELAYVVACAAKEVCF